MMHRPAILYICVTLQCIYEREGVQCNFFHYSDPSCLPTQWMPLLSGPQELTVLSPVLEHFFSLLFLTNISKFPQFKTSSSSDFCFHSHHLFYFIFSIAGPSTSVWYENSVFYSSRFFLKDCYKLVIYYICCKYMSNCFQAGAQNATSAAVHDYRIYLQFCFLKHLQWKVLFSHFLFRL